MTAPVMDWRAVAERLAADLREHERLIQKAGPFSFDSLDLYEEASRIERMETKGAK